MPAEQPGWFLDIKYQTCSNLPAVVVGLSSGTVLSSAVEATPPVAAFLSARGEPLGGVALGDPLITGWDWGVAEGVVFAPVSTEDS